MIDPLSMTSLLIELYFNETKLGVATGFVIERNTILYLATNWHVLAGKDSVTGEIINKNGGLPNAIVIWHHKKSDSHNTLKWVSVKIPLYDNNGEQRWLEHPHGQRVDAVLLPIENVEKVQINKFDLQLAQTDIILAPALPVSIIGFPFGRSAGGLLPFWVTGFIASEPDVDIDGMPLSCVNAAGRSGLSGSPVVLRLTGGYLTSKGNFILNGCYQTKFIGIYSGRIRDDADICRVWKPIVFDQILENIMKQSHD